VVEGEKVWVKQLSDAAMETYQFSRMDLKTFELDGSKVKGAQAELVAMCLCEEDGTKCFKNTKDAAENLPSTFIKAAYKVCSELNGMAAEKDLVEAGKD